MATNAEIAAAITDAESLNVEPAQMVALIDKAMAAALISGLPTASYTINGRSRTIGLMEARLLRKYYSDLASGGGFITQPIEFSPDSHYQPPRPY
jgi:hypothetical protein